MDKQHKRPTSVVTMPKEYGKYTCDNSPARNICLGDDMSAQRTSRERIKEGKEKQSLSLLIARLHDP